MPFLCINCNEPLDPYPSKNSFAPIGTCSLPECPLWGKRQDGIIPEHPELSDIEIFTLGTQRVVEDDFGDPFMDDDDESFSGGQQQFGFAPKIPLPVGYSRYLNNNVTPIKCLGIFAGRPFFVGRYIFDGHERVQAFYLSSGANSKNFNLCLPFNGFCETPKTCFGPRSVDEIKVGWIIKPAPKYECISHMPRHFQNMFYHSRRNTSKEKLNRAYFNPPHSLMRGHALQTFDIYSRLSTLDCALISLKMGYENVPFWNLSQSFTEYLICNLYPVLNVLPKYKLVFDKSTFIVTSDSVTLHNTLIANRLLREHTLSV